MFKITKICEDKNGESYFEEINVQLTDSGRIGKLSENIPVKDVIFREVDPDYDWDFHRAPQKQYIILLDGEIEIETSDGEKRKFTSGDIILAEDVSGKGHRTRNIVQAKRRSVFITLPD
jgi:hypothetical protein